MQKSANAKAVEAMFLALEKTASYREMEKLAFWDSVKDLGGRAWDSAKSYAGNVGKTFSELGNAAGNLAATGGHKLRGAVADAFGWDDAAKQERAVADQKWNNMKQHGQQSGAAAVQATKDWGKTLAYGAGAAAGFTPGGALVHKLRGDLMNQQKQQQATPAAPAPASQQQPAAPAPASQPVAAPTPAPASQAPSLPSSALTAGGDPFADPFGASPAAGAGLSAASQLPSGPQTMAAPAPASQPVEAPAAPAAAKYDPSSITRAQMRQHRNITGAGNMNSDMDKWKTWMAMQGRGREATNKAYYAARKNGFN